MKSQKWPDDLKKEKIIAAKKHAKSLKRKSLKYSPSDWQLYKMYQNRQNALPVVGPKFFSIIQNTDEVINYFDKIRFNQLNRRFVRIDLSKIEYTDLATVSLLMAHMYDERLPWGFLTVTTPAAGTQPADIFKRVQFNESVTKKNSDSAHFLSRHDTDVNQEYKLAILKRVSDFYSGKIDYELNPILTEIFSNTNNHADKAHRGVVPWLVTMEEDVEDMSIKFCVIDLGIGIYNSLTMKKDRLSRLETALNAIKDFFKSSQNETLSSNIPKGLLSTTNLDYRGQGIKEIYEVANGGSFKLFNIITNKAHVNLLNPREINKDSMYNFRGTLYYWTLKYA